MQTTRRSFVTLMGAAPLALAAKSSKNFLVYLGPYTRKSSKGVYVSRFDASTGKATEPELAGEVANPSFLALHPNGKNLYTVSESGNGNAGNLTAFSIDRSSGKLTKLNTSSSKGSGPCHLNVDKTGHSLVVANYGSGSSAALPVNADGTLGEAVGFIQHKGSSVDKRRQMGPHAHSANISLDNRFLVVADLGLDQVLVYKFDPLKSTLEANDPPYVSVKPGGGPRHFTFHPNGKNAYVINEMAATVTAFDWNGKAGSFKEIQTISTVPDGYSDPGNTTAEVRIHPNGKFLYGSNRGHNSLAVFAVAGNGSLRRIENVPTQGKTPRNFCIDPTGKWLFAANQDSGNVVIFGLNPKTGKLTPTGQQLSIDSCVCVRFLAV